MRMPSVRSYLLVGVLAASLGLGGCGSDDDAADKADDVTTTTEAAAPAHPSIELRDYSFAVNGELTAGMSTIDVKNTGKEFHMVGFAKLKPGKTLADATKAFASEDEKAGEAVFEDTEGTAPEGFVGPGQQIGITSDELTAGDYALVCFFPTEGEGAPHFTKGMVAAVTVAAAPAEAPTAPTADAEYTMASGKVTGPATLKAGEVTLKATAGAGGPHEFLLVKAKKAGSSFEEIDKYFDAEFEKKDGPAKGAAANAPFIVVGDLFDFEGTRYMTATLEPGEYFVGCNTSGEEESTDANSHAETMKVVVS
ncbi:MAG TPA: hypothetical protein VM030_11925 [Acidimicrobiales bacterium]|nr:hypothetical protein [Acidimicrobiales bacterium]